MPLDWDETEALAVIERHAKQRGALLPLLHAVQDLFGHIPDPVVPLVAQRLRLSRAEVEGVISFYKDFRRQARGRHVVTLCRAEACQAMGAEDLVAQLRHRLSMDMDTTHENGDLTLETVYCLGNCALGPSAVVDGQLIGRATAERIEARLKVVP
ncbi:formate dehydrogenase subunit gamma [Magnetospira sp. QH-2]|uniref:formate dehydrogenase subunit gamma n=1 Tax=Magnetospira sp. (strain QH-2) TaxID=1288970 RepID=UPI0003E80E3E|nr:formate dehydrogenase subunit gamma [Magnetospira sp. QH-2]CCQ72464.1 putative formate dehydrogenase gamma subunit FdsG [Magnetospira sp. QH-2]